MDKKQAFSDRLNLALDAIGFARKGKGRQAQLAVKMGVTQKGARKWLEGEAIPGQENMADLAVLCGVYCEWLQTGRGPMHVVEPRRRDPEIERWADCMESLPPGEREKIFQITAVLSAPSVPLLPEKAA